MDQIQYLTVYVVFFLLGITVVSLNRKNISLMLMSIELMLLIAYPRTADMGTDQVVRQIEMAIIDTAHSILSGNGTSWIISASFCRFPALCL